MSNEYKIATLIDMLDLDDDQIDRLCAELPSLLKHIKGLEAILKAALGSDDEVLKIINPLTWIDDGKKEINLTAICSDGEELEYKVSEAI